MSAAARIRNSVQRLESPARIPGVDLARGIALLGMLVAHLMIVSRLTWSDPQSWDGVVDGRSSILFATLAGVSLALVAGSATPPSGYLRRLFCSRALLIWVLGAVLATLSVPLHIILPAYGILLLVGTWLLRFSTPVLIAVAAAAAVLGPVIVAAVGRINPLGPVASELLYRYTGWHYPFVMWLAFIAAGVVAGRMLLEQQVRAALVLTAVGAVLATIGYGVLGPVAGTTRIRALSLLNDVPHESGIGEAVGSGGFALAVLGLCVLLCATPVRWLLWPLRAVGSMPLTAYTAHVLSWWVWIQFQPGIIGITFDPLWDFQAVNPLWPSIITLLIGCSLWALLIGRGPLEMGLGRTAIAMASRDHSR